MRRQIGARLEGISKLANNVTLFVRAPRTTRLATRHPGWMYRFFGGAIDGGDRWLLHVDVPPGQPPDSFDRRPTGVRGGRRGVRVRR